MKRIITSLIIVLGVIVLWSGLWFFGAHYLRTQLTSTQTTSASVHCATLDISGYPLRYDLDCKDLSFIDGDITLRATEAKAAAYVFAPDRIVAQIDGPANYADAFTGSQRRLDFDTVQASLRFWGTMLKRVSIVGKDMTLYDTLIEDTQIADLQNFEFHILDVPERYNAQDKLMSTHINIRAQKLDIVGTDVRKADIYLDARANNLPDNVLTWSRPDILPFWQSSSGTLEIETLDATTPDAKLNLTGQLQLDTAGRPEGTLDITSNGVVERLDGILPPDLGPVITGSPDEEGTYHQTVRLTGGVVLAGIMPVAMVPPLY